jgi:hypothetical protein
MSNGATKLVMGWSFSKKPHASDEPREVQTKTHRTSTSSKIIDPFVESGRIDWR